jgi:LuxR family maltose regulon positive regulatory protein
MVVAGEGYGKSSAVYSFLQTGTVVSSWVQLTDRDNISRHFWENLCSSLYLQSPYLGAALLDLGLPETNGQFDRFCALVENAVGNTDDFVPVFGNFSPDEIPRYVLVYDDFHLIHDPTLLRLFNRTLAFPFPNTTIVLIVRAEPKIKTLPLLSKGLLARITVEDLRFTPEETAEYFATQHLEVSREDAESFWRDTEGWPQVLSLLVQDALKQNKTEIRYSPELVKLPLFKMIESSFFSSLDRDTRLFLIKLSLGEYWPLELLDKLDATGKQREGLDKISPLIRYDSYLNGYRIHNLLVEFLKEKQHELSVGEGRQVYRKTAEWCLDNNLRLDAAAYYEKARDYRGFYNLGRSLPIVIPGQTASFFLSIIERLPFEEDLAQGDGGEEPAWRDVLLYLRFVMRSRLLFAMSRFDEAALVCRRAIAEFEGQDPGLNGKFLSPLYFCLGCIMILTCRHTGDYDFAPWFEKALHYYKPRGILVSRGFSQGSISSYVCQVGFPARWDAFEVCLEAYTRAVPLIAKVGGGHLSGLDSLGRCEYCYFQGDLQAAENFARQAIIQARVNHQYETENRGLFFLLRIAIHNGDFTGIEELFRLLKAQLDIGDYQNRYVLYDIECAWFYAQTGNLAPIASWLRSDAEIYEVNDMLRPLETLVRAKCFYAEKRYRAALSVLETGKSRNNLDSFLLGKLEKTVLEAGCRLYLGDRRAAAEKLMAAREISGGYGLDTPFVELGENMRVLASLALNGGKAPGFVPFFPEASGSGATPWDREWLESVQKRAAAYGKMLAGAAAHGPGMPVSPQMAGIHLRRREKAVLAALSEGLTREEIAGRERLSLGAVKEIIKNTYQKLGAVNRADAIRIALALGLLKKDSR